MITEQIKEQIFEEVSEMYNHLLKAYEIAGGLRDTFTGIGENEGALKKFCNKIRGGIYELREFKGSFGREITKIKE